MKTMTQSILITLALAAAFVNTIQAAPFSNGDFTQGAGTAEWTPYTTDAWTLEPGTGVLHVEWVWNPHNTVTYHYARFERDFGGKISQTFDTIAGGTYNVTFQMLYWWDSWAESFRVTAPGLDRNTTHDEVGTDLSDEWGGTSSYLTGYEFKATSHSSTLAFQRISVGEVPPYGSANPINLVALTNVKVTLIKVTPIGTVMAVQ